MLKLTAAIAALALAPFVAHAQADHAAHANQSAHANHNAPAVAAARLSLDTPVEVIAADAAGKAVLEANLPGVTTHEHYEAFKAMGLRQIAGMAPAQLPAEVLAKIEAELAAIK